MKRRYLHNLSHYHNTTLSMGELVPVGLVDVLPGDSVRHAVSALIRCSPLLAPVMHPISVRLHSFFVPMRLLWDDWESFITGGDDGEGDGAVPPVYPEVNQPEGSLSDYLGIPPDVAHTNVNVMPYRAYNLIYNEYYRDKDLQSELAISTAGGNDATTTGVLQRVAWEKDYFTAARPWPQKGPEITMPLGESAEVVSAGSGAAGVPSFKGQSTVGTVRTLVMQSSTSETAWGSGGAPANPGIDEAAQWNDPNLIADLSTATSASVTELRRAIALQSYQEAAAMYGSDYVDYLRFQFGTRSDDARLQRPEYLGGGRQTISFSEVLQTGPDSADDGVADLKGHGIAAMRSRSYTRFFNEHGYIMTLMSVRPRSIYSSGLARPWFKSTKEDYFQHQLENIGMQAVLNKEVYADHASPDGTFGYNDRYAEYRHIPSRISGEFRSTLNHWHLARIFASDPALNSSFITCDPGKRIHAEQTADNLWVMVNHSLKARRQVAPPRPGRTL